MNDICQKIILIYWYWTAKVIGIPNLKKKFYSRLLPEVQSKCAIFFLSFLIFNYFPFIFLMEQFNLIITWQIATSENLVNHRPEVLTLRGLTEHSMKFLQWIQQEEPSHQQHDQLNTAMVHMVSCLQGQVTCGIFFILSSLLSSYI